MDEQTSLNGQRAQLPWVFPRGVVVHQFTKSTCSESSHSQSLRTPVLGPSEFPRVGCFPLLVISHDSDTHRMGQTTVYSLRQDRGCLHKGCRCSQLEFSWRHCFLEPNDNPDLHTSGPPVSPSSSGTSKKPCLAPECTHNLSFHLYKC